MFHFFVSPQQIGEKQITITGNDVRHIRNVLRMKEGDELKVRTGEDDRDFRCRIAAFENESILLDIMWVEHEDAELPCSITLYQGLPKSDKMEMIIQKAVELGAARIVPVIMHRSVAKVKEGKADAKLKRWNAIAESAAKQSKRMHIPAVDEILTFKQAAQEAEKLDVVLLPYELAQDMEHTRQVLGSIRPGQSVGIFIGPEGGFEESEAKMLEEAGAHVITLGRRILRTETAGMALLSMLTFILEGREAADGAVGAV